MTLRRRLVAASVTLCILALATGAQAAPRASSESPAGLSGSEKAAVTRIVAQLMAKHHVPGASVAVGRGGALAWATGFGEADVENHAPALADSVYRAASINKAMTATLAVRLSEQGKLDLDAPVQRYCPHYPLKDQPVTVRSVMTHSSGIRGYTGPNAEAEVYNVRHYERIEDAIDLFAADPLIQRPGSGFAYTTWGYVVLGCVVEGASKQDYLAALQDRVLGPAGMAATREDDPRAVTPLRAHGYVLDKGVLKNSRWTDLSSRRGGASLLTTAPDTVRFMNALMGGKLISHAALNRVLTPADPKIRGLDNMGLGWFIDDYHGRKAAFHTGAISQVSAIVFFAPDDDVSVALFFNLEGVPGLDRLQACEAIADALTGRAAVKKER